MHSERTELHLQHMIERTQMGAHGEEEEIAELLFDEVYTLVRTIYKEDEKTHKVVNTILERYTQSLKDRKILDIHKNVQVYAVVRIYQALCKKRGELYPVQENMQDYVYPVISDDPEFEKIADTYGNAFESVRAYKSKKEAFRNLKAEKMLLLILFAYEKCTVNEISRTLNIDEAVVKNEIADLRSIIMEIGADTAEADHESRSHERKNSHSRAQKEQALREEEMGLADYLFPNMGKGVRTAVDLAMAAAVFLVYFIFLR